MSFGSEFGNKGSLFNWHMPKDYPFRNESLFPVVQEGSDDIAAVALVNGRVVIHKDFPSFPIFM